MTKSSLVGMPARVASSLPTLIPGEPSPLFIDTSGRLYVTGGASGNVSGPNPAASTDNAIVRWDGTGGNTLQNSLVTIGDTGSMIWSSGFSISNTGLLTIPDGQAITAGTTNGLKIGTNSSQKLGFFNATPVAQLGTYTVTNTTPSRTLDGSTATAATLANVLAQLIADLKALGFNA